MQKDNRQRLENLVDRFLDHLQVTSFSPLTLDSYRCHLNIFTNYLVSQTSIEALENVTPEILFRYQTYLYSWTNGRGRGLSIPTQAARLSAVRSLFRHLVKTDVVRFDPASAVTLPKRRYPLPRSILSKRQVSRLLRAPDTSTLLGLRDRAMLEVLYSAGIRNAELRRLKLADID